MATIQPVSRTFHREDSCLHKVLFQILLLVFYSLPNLALNVSLNDYFFPLPLFSGYWVGKLFKIL